MAKGKGPASSPPPTKRASDIARFQAAQTAGNITPRQQQRLTFLQRQQGAGGAKAPAYKRDYISPTENKLINQTQGQDLTLGNAANQQLGNVQENFQQPFNWNEFQSVNQPNWNNVPQGPVSGDYNQWRKEQIDLSAKDFEDRVAPVFAQQRDDFEQQMSNRGIPMGSELYNRQLEQLQQQQEGQRQNNLVAAMNQAGSNASQFANVGFQAHDQGMGDQQTYYNQQVAERNRQTGEALGQRYQPLNEFQMLRGAQSPQQLAALQYYQQMQQGNQAGNFALQAKRMGGGGAAPSDPNNYNNTGMSYQDYAAFNMANQMALNASNRPQQPNPWASVIGGVGAGFAQGYGSTL